MNFFDVPLIDSPGTFLRGSIYRNPRPRIRSDWRSKSRKTQSNYETLSKASCHRQRFHAGRKKRMCHTVYAGKLIARGRCTNVFAQCKGTVLLHSSMEHLPYLERYRSEKGPKNEILR